MKTERATNILWFFSNIWKKTTEKKKKIWSSVIWPEKQIYEYVILEKKQVPILWWVMTKTIFYRK